MYLNHLETKFKTVKICKLKVKELNMSEMGGIWKNQSYTPVTPPVENGVSTAVYQNQLSLDRWFHCSSARPRKQADAISDERLNNSPVNLCSSVITV